MDPESAAFQPRDDLWRVQSEMLRVQQSQSELADRVARLERRSEDDSRLKNVWGTSSPFPSVLTGTPQQVPLQQPTAEHFSNFDDHSSTLIGNLQLDADDEPRRIGTTSRANSVRFDETANHGHWAHASRSSLDLIPRTGSGLGGHLMSERSYSHKSDGRQSSAGHSVHSATSGRANSLTGFGLNTPLEPPGLAPGLFILGTVPAIIRCWLNTDFKHNTLLYAAICSGSYASYLDMRLIERLGYEDRLVSGDDGSRQIKLPMYLPEAIPLSNVSRSSSPAPQLPSIHVEFTVIERNSIENDSKAVQVFLGSDTLRSHNADILFSSNQLNMYDEDDSKLQIPLVRPEDENTFKSLYITSGSPNNWKSQAMVDKPVQASSEAGTVGEGSVSGSMLERRSNSNARSNGTALVTSSDEGGSSGRPSLEQRPFLGLSTNRMESKESTEASPASAAPRTGASSAIWSNWRRDTEKPSSLDWTSVGKATGTTYQRRDTGIKVLKPSKTSTSRSLSTSMPSPAATGQSRFFDEGKRRESNASRGEGPAEPQLHRSVSGEKGRENAAPTLPKTRAANPVGGASAFAWLNSGGSKPPSVTTASTKKRKIAAAAHDPSAHASHSPHDPGAVPSSPRSDPLRPSVSPPPPRYIPPHMHDEVFEAIQEAAIHPRDTTATAASSPSEAYSNLTLETREHTAAMSQDADGAAPPRPPPRSSSPAKRLHSDMDDAGKEAMDLDNASSSPRATKALPTPAQRSLRSTSVDMLDVTANGTSAASSDTASNSNHESAATSVSQPSPAGSAASIPTVDDQVQKVLALAHKPIGDGQEGYIISEKWLERVFSRTTENILKPDQFNKEAIQGEIGPVDSSNLVDSVALAEDLSDQDGDIFVPLKPGQTMGHDFEVLPQDAWELILGWYGLKEGNPVIRRYAHNTSLDEFQENIQYELYPPIFTIRRLRKTLASAQAAQDTARRATKIVTSRSDGYQDFLRTAKKAVGIDLKTKVQVWRVLNVTPTAQPAPQPSGMLTPESSPRNGSPAPASALQPTSMFIDHNSFANLTEGTEREMVTVKDETANDKYNGHMNLQLAGLAEDQVLILEEQDDKGGFFSQTSKKGPLKNGLESGNGKNGNKAGRGLHSNTNSGRNSPAASGPMTRGRTRNGRTRGTVGLTNLGNTCYMNSALQCIRSVQELSTYFLTDRYKSEINADNPLGHGGAIAKSYAGVLSAIYSEDSLSSFAPKNFKNVLGRAQPLFSGYGQQDSQEFLSFLVDGLHEDLNRVKKKPYTENPENDDNTIHDPEAIKALGQKFRDIHHSRNDSVAMDLFNGFYKNTVVCPDCDKVSITFDPYSLVTLQLPIEQTWQHTITFLPLFGQMIKVEVDIDKNATIRGLKEYIAKRFPGVQAKRLMGAEIYSHKFYRNLEDNKSIAECNIAHRDEIFFFELEYAPTNWPPRKKPVKFRSMLLPSASSEEDVPSSDSPMADKMLVPVFHRGPNTSSYRSQQWSMVLWPSYVVITREEAKDYDSILRKVLAKVGQMTTRDIFADCNSGSDSLEQSRTGSDVVLTTEEDASSSGDPRVQDGSVEGEDNMVEVTMTDPADTPADEQMEDSEDAVPGLLKAGGFIPPEFRTLFDIKHTRKQKEMVPTGWSSIDANKSYDLISARIRTPPSRQSSVQSFDGSSNASSDDETDDNPQFSAAASMEIANQSSEEETMPSIEMPGSARGGRQKNSKKNKRQNKKKAQKMQGKKGKERFAVDQPSRSFSDAETESDDEAGLIRLGEALVLEWKPDAFDALFEGTNMQDPRGMDTLKFVETLDDPELQEKKSKRAQRKKNGITLEECFAETAKSEILSEENAWYCNRCKERRRATKTLELWTVPDILVIHLKRFSAHRTFRDKIEALVDFPVEGLDLSDKVGLPEDKELLYDLFAVDNHYGGLGGGHYTAYAKNFFDQKWYEYNDSSVSSRRDPASVVTSSAYLLFYRRRASHPLGPPYLQKLTDVYMDPTSDDADDSDEAKSRNASPSGNGSRLGDSSRNGSSSGGAAAAGALRGAGSALAANRAQNGAAAGTADADEDEIDDTLPPAYDEGYGGDEDDTINTVDIHTLYAPLFQQARNLPSPQWNFSSIDQTQEEDDVYDETASNAPNMGSRAGDDLDNRMLEDFGDEPMHPGMGTPQLEDEGIPDLLDDEPAAEIRLDPELEEGKGVAGVV
ncbi:UCH-domain-containing protein [Polyplosphaeria fusca]|uniref:ubiquitinyl hydrolase 1 n=1 Tax=Polyplosphaeria fusca TaxID=682080 RepID=A0A9P4QV29_9PLEO|nr:UCH-domain-containing protein [Polyplosphaeria fusca]